MPSDLERFRNHCRVMAESTPQTRVKAAWTGGAAEQTMPVGLMSDEDRDRWRMLAGEADAFLRAELAVEVEPDDHDPLF